MEKESTDLRNNAEDWEGETQVSSGEMGAWFYFQENGRMVRATDGEYADRRINGYRYYLLSKEDAEDNLMRVDSKEIAAELLEMTFGFDNVKMHEK